MIALDAGALTAHVQTGDAFHSSASALIRRRGSAGLIIAVLTLAECMVRAVETGTEHDLLGVVDDLGIAVVPLIPDDAVPLARVRAETALRMPDALVLHTAETARSELTTTDRRLAAAARDRGVTVHEL